MNRIASSWINFNAIHLEVKLNTNFSVINSQQIFHRWGNTVLQLSESKKPKNTFQIRFYDNRRSRNVCKHSQTQISQPVGTRALRFAAGERGIFKARSLQTVEKKWGRGGEKKARGLVVSVRGDKFSAPSTEIIAHAGPGGFSWKLSRRV